MGIQKVRENTINRWFYRIMSVLIFLFVMGLIYDPLGTQLNVFFLKTNNFLADFFNVQIYIADWDPYHNTVNGMGEKCYFPFTYLILEIFKGFHNYSGAMLAECYTSSTAMISCILFMLVSLALLYHSLECLCEVSAKLKFVLLFSSVILYSIERGNIIIFCAALIIYFIAFKDSDNRWKRYFALFCLCVVSIIKIYPVLIGLYLLKDRRYKDIAFCIVCSSILTFIPFLVFKGGLSNFFQMFDNYAVFAQSYSYYSVFPRFGVPHIFAWGMCGLHIDRNIADYILLFPKLLVYLAGIVSMMMSFYEKGTWKRLALIVLPIIMLPINSGFYCGLYFIPVIIQFLSNNQGRRIDFIYMILICVFLNPFQFGVIKGIIISQLLSNIALLVMWLFLLIEATNRILRQKGTSKISIL